MEWLANTLKVIWDGCDCLTGRKISCQRDYWGEWDEGNDMTTFNVDITISNNERLIKPSLLTGEK